MQRRNSDSTVAAAKLQKENMLVPERKSACGPSSSRKKKVFSIIFIRETHTYKRRRSKSILSGYGLDYDASIDRNRVSSEKIQWKFGGISQD